MCVKTVIIMVQNSWFALFVLGFVLNINLIRGQEAISAADSLLLSELQSTEIELEKWIGKWTGNLQIIKGSQVLQTIPMRMEISQGDSTGSFLWSTVYGDEEQTTKPYNLDILNAETGRYLLDEHNGIKIETYQHGDQLVSLV